MPGYWQDEEATAAAFEAGWYKTGDLGYLDESGNLFLKGRKKDLIVLANGQNVYADDVERALNAHPAVAEAVVAGLPDERSGAETVHAILLLEDPSVPVKEIIEEANAKLADKILPVDGTAATFRQRRRPTASPTTIVVPIPTAGLGTQRLL